MKTIEEKAKAYADRPATAKTWGMRKSALIDAYIAGATEALAGQWRSVEDELPETDDYMLVIYSCSYTPKYKEKAIAYYDGEDWYTQDGEHIRPSYWMSIPEPKNESE